MSSIPKQPGSNLDSSYRAAFRHCVIITVIALIAIAIAWMLPRDERQMPRRIAQDPARVVGEAPAASNFRVPEAASLPGDARVVDKPAAGFDAEFNTPNALEVVQ